jgi:hypothetical protein
MKNVNVMGHFSQREPDELFSILNFYNMEGSFKTPITLGASLLWTISNFWNSASLDRVPCRPGKKKNKNKPKTGPQKYLSGPHVARGPWVGHLLCRNVKT